jgi:hypothetical protein
MSTPVCVSGADLKDALAGLPDNTKSANCKAYAADKFFGTMPVNTL